LTFQPEPVSKLTASILLSKIKKSNRKCGLAFKPHTDLNKYVSLIKKCDYVTIMGVEPGFGGQQFMKEITLNNLVLINKIKKEYNPKLVVQLDGGVNFEVIKLTSKYVDNFISGSFLIKQKDPKAVVKFVQQI
jgi:ribulose-phosphate 3-epimerase